MHGAARGATSPPSPSPVGEGLGGEVWRDYHPINTANSIAAENAPYPSAASASRTRAGVNGI
jgi:hypothetical protein